MSISLIGASQTRSSSQAQEAIDAVQNIKISALEVTVQSIRDDNRRITDKMSEMKTSLDEARGTAKSLGALLIVINIIQAVLQFKNRNGNHKNG